MMTFDTRNREIHLPKDYQENYNQLHRKDQNYVVEIFMGPGGSPNQFMLLNEVEMQDMTLKKLTEIFSAGTLKDPLCVLSYFDPTCEEYRTHLSRQDVFEILKYFNTITGKNVATGLASRDKDETSTIMESEGGSRIDYRYLTATLGLGAFGNDRSRGYTALVIPV
jgi:hypothetical protein